MISDKVVSHKKVASDLFICIVEVNHTMMTFEISDNAAVHSLMLATVALSQNPTSTHIKI